MDTILLHVARIQSFKPGPNTISFPGFSPTRPMEHSIGRVGENPVNEVGPNSHELGIVGSVRTSNFLIKGKLNLKRKLGYGDFKADLPTLTIFYLLSRTHDKTPNLTVFGKNHSEMKCYLVE